MSDKSYYGKHKLYVGMVLYDIGPSYSAYEEPKETKIIKAEMQEDGDIYYFMECGYGYLFSYEINDRYFFTKERAERHIKLRQKQEEIKKANDARESAELKRWGAIAAEKANEFIGKNIIIRDFHIRAPDESKPMKATIKDVYFNEKGLRITILEGWNSYLVKNEGKTWRFITEEEKAELEAIARAKEEDRKAKEKIKIQEEEDSKRLAIESAQKRLDNVQNEYNDILKREVSIKKDLQEAQDDLLKLQEAK